MFKPFKTYRLRSQEKRLALRLEELFHRADDRRDANPSNDALSYYDYLDAAEQREYSKLATEHYYVCQQLGQSSSYFSVKRDPVHNDPNSPKGLTTVTHDVSSKVEVWRSPFTDGAGNYRTFAVRDGELEYIGLDKRDEANVKTFYEIAKNL